MKVEWTPLALSQVQEIFAYIVRDRPQVAVEIVDGLFDATELLSATPEMGALWRPDQRRDLRFVPYKTYRVLYRVDEDGVFVVSVKHTGAPRTKRVGDSYGVADRAFSLTCGCICSGETGRPNAHLA